VPKMGARQESLPGTENNTSRCGGTVHARTQRRPLFLREPDMERSRLSDRARESKVHQ